MMIPDDDTGMTNGRQKFFTPRAPLSFLIAIDIVLAKRTADDFVPMSLLRVAEAWDELAHDREEMAKRRSHQ